MGGGIKGPSPPPLGYTPCTLLLTVVVLFTVVAIYPATYVFFYAKIGV